MRQPDEQDENKNANLNQRRHAQVLDAQHECPREEVDGVNREDDIQEGVPDVAERRLLPPGARRVHTGFVGARLSLAVCARCQQPACTHRRSKQAEAPEGDPEHDKVAGESRMHPPSLTSRAWRVELPRGVGDNDRIQLASNDRAKSLLSEVLNKVSSDEKEPASQLQIGLSPTLRPFGTVLAHDDPPSGLMRRCGEHAGLLSEPADRLANVALHLHRSSSPAVLADQLADFLAAEPLDVFVQELILVSSAGVERWLAQRLSHRLGAAGHDDGVTAGLDVLSPASLISVLLDRHSNDPWAVEQLTWSVLKAMDDLAPHPGFETLAHHIGADPGPPQPAPGDNSPAAQQAHEQLWQRRARQTRRYAVARRLAGLYVRYNDDRPELMRAWEAGQDEAPSDLTWQAPLWQAVVAHIIATTDQDCSAIARHDRVVAQLRSGLAPDGIGARLSLFGQTRLSTTTLELLDALATQRDVHLWLPHPSPALWDALNIRQHRSAAPAVNVRADDHSDAAAHHPLLATLGRDVRELQSKLMRYDVTDESVTTPPALAPSEPPTRLHLLQTDIANNRPVSTDVRLAGDDASIQVHACHGRARQVDALREMLVWLVDENGGGLQPRDILVMCPDIEEFAPLIRAAFTVGDTELSSGGTRHHPGALLRVQLADQGIRNTNPLATAATHLVSLVAGRLTVTELLDFIELPAVAQKFSFNAEEMDRLASWIEQTGARWGLDEHHRQDFYLGGVPHNTWAQAANKLALGIAVGADTDGPAGMFAPLDDVGNSDIDLAARFLTLLEAIAEAANSWRTVSTENPQLPRGTHTMGEWQRWLREHTLALAAAAPDAQWQVAQFDRAVSDLANGDAQLRTLRMTDLRVLLTHRWAGRAGRANFRNGAISVCTMTPMRSVPHKAVLLLGMDDGVLPRAQIVDGDDVLARSPQVGERDGQSEDRQLVLDAIMAASEYFMAFYTGFNERTGAASPPCVPLQEILSVATRTGRPPQTSHPATSKTAQPLLHEHPLQAFDARNFTAFSPIPGGSYDAPAFDGAQHAQQRMAAHGADERGRQRTSGLAGLLPGPLPPQPTVDVSVDELIEFVHNPARTFCRTRLDIAVPSDVTEPQDDIPLTLDSLQQWAIGDRLLRQSAETGDLNRAVALEELRGSVPPGPLGHDLQAITHQVRQVLSAVPNAPRRSVDIAVDVPLGPAGTPVRLTGVVPGVMGPDVTVMTYSRLGAKKLLEAWIKLLAAVASESSQAGPALAGAGEQAVRSAVVRTKDGTVRLHTPAPAEAMHLLAELLSMYQSGLRSPLPLPVKSTYKYAEKCLSLSRTARADDTNIRERAAAQAEFVWSGKFPERSDRWWTRVLGEAAPWSAVMSLPTPTNTSFDSLSRGLWFPVLDAMQEISS